MMREDKCIGQRYLWCLSFYGAHCTIATKAKSLRYLRLSSAQVIVEGLLFSVQLRKIWLSSDKSSAVWATEKQKAAQNKRQAGWPFSNSRSVPILSFPRCKTTNWKMPSVHKNTSLRRLVVEKRSLFFSPSADVEILANNISPFITGLFCKV